MVRHVVSAQLYILLKLGYVLKSRVSLLVPCSVLVAFQAPEIDLQSLSTDHRCEPAYQFIALGTYTWKFADLWVCTIERRWLYIGWSLFHVIL